MTIIIIIQSLLLLSLPGYWWNNKSYQIIYYYCRLFSCYYCVSVYYHFLFRAGICSGLSRCLIINWMSQIRTAKKKPSRRSWSESGCSFWQLRCGNWVFNFSVDLAVSGFNLSKQLCLYLFTVDLIDLRMIFILFVNF